MPPSSTTDVTAPEINATSAAGLEQLPSYASLPGSPRYELARPWNQAIEHNPRLVLHPKTQEEVAAAVRLAGQLRLQIAVRRTGHGALRADQQTLVLHTAGLDGCEVDVAGRWARVGAGTLWQQVIDAAAPHGLAPVCGAAPQIGVAGFLTGGGIGPLVRTYGAGSDHVRAIEVVTGSGQILRATPTEHEDLFWGLRGSKQTLGIVTAVEIDLVPLAEFYGGCLWFDDRDADTVLHRWLELCEQLPEEGTTSAAIMQLPPLAELPAPIAGRQTVAIRFAWVGDPQAAELRLAPLRSAVTPLLDDVRLRPAAEIGRVHNDPVHPMPVRDHAALMHSVTNETIDRLLAAVNTGPNLHSVIELRQLGGALARPPRHPSAFCHRETAYTLFMSGIAKPDHLAIDEQAERITAELSAWLSENLWANFRPSSDPTTIARYYDADTRHWLTALAAQHDPDHLLTPSSPTD